MKKQETLSDKRIQSVDIFIYDEEDVKEFIQDLKESDIPFQWISGGCDEEVCRKIWKEFIDNLAGPDLIDNHSHHDTSGETVEPSGDGSIKYPEDKEPVFHNSGSNNHRK